MHIILFYLHIILFRCEFITKNQIYTETKNQNYFKKKSHLIRR